MLVRLDATLRNPTLSFNCFSANSNCCWSCWYFCVALPWKTMSWQTGRELTWWNLTMKKKSSSSPQVSASHQPQQKESISSHLWKKGVSSCSQLWGFSVFKKGYPSTNFRRGYENLASTPNLQPLNIPLNISSPQEKDQPVVHESEAMDPSKFPRCSNGSSATIFGFWGGRIFGPIHSVWKTDLVGGLFVVWWFTYSILN